MADLPTLSVVLITALIDSINPCAIGVLIILLSTLLHIKHNRSKLLSVGLIYISAVFVTYFAAGFGILYFIQQFSLSYMLSWIVGIIIIILGVLEFHDAFAKKAMLAINPKHAKKIMHMIKHISIPGSILLGMFVAAVELPCTGGPYLAITTILSQTGISVAVVGLLALYNFIFVLPLLIILGLVYFGLSAKQVESWKNTNKQWMRVANGIILILLGILLILWAMGVLGL